jgi:hypothetical protein
MINKVNKFQSHNYKEAKIHYRVRTRGVNCNYGRRTSNRAEP